MEEIMEDLLKRVPTFGSVETTKIIDDNGSTITKTTDYKNGMPKSPVRVTFRFRERVYSDQEALKKHLAFSEELAATPSMLDPVWLPKERSKDGDANGYYYVVKGYTLLDY